MSGILKLIASFTWILGLLAALIYGAYVGNNDCIALLTGTIISVSLIFTIVSIITVLNWIKDRLYGR